MTRKIFVPPTLERPAMELVGKEVSELPSNPSVGELVTFQDRLMTWTGATWVDVTDMEW